MDSRIRGNDIARASADFYKIPGPLLPYQVEGKLCVIDKQSLFTFFVIPGEGEHKPGIQGCFFKA